MESIVIVLILLVVFAFLVYCLLVMLVQFYKNEDTKTAKKRVDDFFKVILSFLNKKEKVIYPVNIGIDENEFAHSDVIEQEFDSLKKIFKTFYFYDFSIQSNRLLYQFKVGVPLKEMEESDLIKLCNSYCEKIIHNFMHKMNPSLSHVNHIVSVDIIEGILSVHVAVNETGTKENAEMTENVRKRILENDLNLFDTMEEEWGDDNDLGI